MLRSFVFAIAITFVCVPTIRAGDSLLGLKNFAIELARQVLLPKKGVAVGFFGL